MQALEIEWFMAMAFNFSCIAPRAARPQEK
jgi:hypothetical protein